MQLLLVINPTAGLDLPVRVAEIVRATLRRRRIPMTIDTAVTDGPGDAFRLAEAGRDRYDIVAAVGGDGTVREVAGGLRGGRALLAILPNGTANVLAADLGIPLRLGAAAALLGPDAPTMPLDVGDVNGYPFVLNVGIGYAARLILDTPTTLKRRIGFFAYLPAAVRAAFSRERGIVTVRMGECEYQGPVQMVFIGNSGGIGGNVIYIAPDVHPTDGQLTVSIFAPRSPLATLWTFMQIAMRQYESIRGATYWRGSEVTVQGDPSLPLEIDGDAGGTIPCTVRISPGALRVIVPRKRTR